MLQTRLKPETHAPDPPLGSSLGRKPGAGPAQTPERGQGDMGSAGRETAEVGGQGQCAMRDSRRHTHRQRPGHPSAGQPQNIRKSPAIQSIPSRSVCPKGLGQGHRAPPSGHTCLSPGGCEGGHQLQILALCPRSHCLPS